MLDALLLARIQFAANISFHILFPMISIALTWMLLFFKWRYNRTGEDYWMNAYRLFVKVFALSFALGVVSGITMSFQFGTNWPGFMPTATLPAYHAYLTDGGEVLFHPETAELVAEWNTLDALPAFLFELHTYLFLGETGHTLVGVLGIAVLINLVIGFTLWLRKRGVFRLRFVLPKSAARPQLIRGHAAQGSLLSAAFFLLAFSGVAMVFAAPVQASFDAVFGAADSLRPTPLSLQRDSVAVDWHKVILKSAEVLPTAELRFLSIPDTPGKPVIARLRNGGELHPNGRSYAVLHPESGQVFETIDATQSGLGPSLFDSLYPIHAHAGEIVVEESDDERLELRWGLLRGTGYPADERDQIIVDFRPGSFDGLSFRVEDNVVSGLSFNGVYFER